jgi:hypothetical protein
MESGDWRQPSNAIFVAPTATNTALAVTLPKDVITRKSPLTKIPTTEGTYVLTSNFSTALAAGKSYNLNVKLRAAKWAGSNIYWDTDKLTFDEYGTTTNQGYQGVFFKWGSLVGIAPTAPGYNYVEGSTPVYTPNGSGGWTQGTVSSYAGILYWDSSSYGNDFDFSHGTTLGDVCKAIKSTYRLPKNGEFGTTAWSAWGGDAGGAWVAKGSGGTTYSNAAAGTDDLIASGHLYAENATMENVCFPSSGYYSVGSGGKVAFANYGGSNDHQGCYWHQGSGLNCFYFDSNQVCPTTLQFDYTCAVSVRCVLDD